MGVEFGVLDYPVALSLTGTRTGRLFLPDLHQNDARQEAPMKRAYFISLFLSLTTSLLSQPNSLSLINQSAKVVSPISASQADPKAQARILDSYGKLPLSFEANHGQTDAQVKFLSRTGGYSLFLTGDEAVLTLSGKKAKEGTSGLSRIFGWSSGMAQPCLPGLAYAQTPAGVCCG